MLRWHPWESRSDRATRTLSLEPRAEDRVLPTDLPRVAITGVPTRLRFGDTPAEQRAYWEWLWVELDAGGALAFFDPDHLCTPGWFGRPCRLGIEFFHPTLAPNPDQRRALVPQGADADPTTPPLVAGRVIAEHRQAWRYTGPVTTYEERDGEQRRIVRHVIDAPQTTLRLALEIGIGTALAQLRDPAEAAPVGAWLALRDGRAELVAIELVERET
jgi:hypothetical protein